jgi:hypothetical protein
VLVEVTRYFSREQRLHCVLPEPVMLESTERIGLYLASRICKILVDSCRRRHSFALLTLAEYIHMQRRCSRTKPPCLGPSAVVEGDPLGARRQLYPTLDISINSLLMAHPSEVSSLIWVVFVSRMARPTSSRSCQSIRLAVSTLYLKQAMHVQWKQWCNVERHLRYTLDQIGM